MKLEDAVARLRAVRLRHEHVLTREDREAIKVVTDFVLDTGFGNWPVKAKP